MIARYDNLTDLWHKTALRQLLATREKLDFVANIDTMLYDNVLHADSMAFDFDMGRDLWLTKSRFTVLQKDYLDLYELSQFLDRCESIGLGEAKRGVVTQMFAKQHSRGHKKYRWGNCMMAWCYRGGNKGERPTLTMHSRVSYIAYIGGLDLALCYVLAREIGERVGCKPEDFQFRWHVDSLQFHGFKSLPYLFRFGLERHLAQESARYPDDQYPTLRLCRRWWQVIHDGKELEDEKYGPLKRIRKRYAEYCAGDFMPAWTLDDMSLDPLRRTG